MYIIDKAIIKTKLSINTIELINLGEYLFIFDFKNLETILYHIYFLIHLKSIYYYINLSPISLFHYLQNNI